MAKIRREELFGRLVVEKNLATQETINHCMAEVKARKAQGEKVNLGKVLVESGILDMRQARVLLQVIQEQYPSSRSAADEPQAPRSESQAQPAADDEDEYASPQEYEETMMAPSVDVDEVANIPAPPPPKPQPSKAAPSVGAVGHDHDPLLGVTFGKYTVQRLLGRGAMGAVYYAENQALRRPAAIKVLPAETDDTNPEFVARFQREARVAAQVEHANLVAVYDVGQEGKWHYLVMQFVEGRTWGDMVKEAVKMGTPLPVQDSLRYARDAMSGLAAAHGQGITHRDIKPDNIMIATDGSVKITDFGLARAEGGEVLTVAGRALGTPRFMSPEQWRGGSPDTRWDLYALGMTLYFSLTNDFPYQTGRNQIDLIRNMMQHDPIPATAKNPRVTEDVNMVVMRLIDKNINTRYQTAEEALIDLNACLSAMSTGTVAAVSGSSFPVPESEHIDEEVPSAVAASTRTAHAPAAPAKSQNPVMLLLIIMIVLLVLLVAILGYIVLTQNSGSNTTEGMLPQGRLLQDLLATTARVGHLAPLG